MFLLVLFFTSCTLINHPPVLFLLVLFFLFRFFVVESCGCGRGLWCCFILFFSFFFFLQRNKMTWLSLRGQRNKGWVGVEVQGQVGEGGASLLCFLGRSRPRMPRLSVGDGLGLLGQGGAQTRGGSGENTLLAGLCEGVEREEEGGEQLHCRGGVCFGLCLSVCFVDCVVLAFAFVPSHSPSFLCDFLAFEPGQPIRKSQFSGRTNGQTAGFCSRCFVEEKQRSRKTNERHQRERHHQSSA